jgi:hypothetical protein
LASRAGFSNHLSGRRILGMSAIGDVDGDADLVVPDAALRRVRVVTLAGGVFRELPPLERGRGRIVTGLVLGDSDGDGTPELAYGLMDGTLIVVGFGG